MRATTTNQQLRSFIQRFRAIFSNDLSEKCVHYLQQAAELAWATTNDDYVCLVMILSKPLRVFVGFDTKKLICRNFLKF